LDFLRAKKKLVLLGYQELLASVITVPVGTREITDWLGLSNVSVTTSCRGLLMCMPPGGATELDTPIAPIRTRVTTPGLAVDALPATVPATKAFLVTKTEPAGATELLAATTPASAFETAPAGAAEPLRATTPGTTAEPVTEPPGAIQVLLAVVPATVTLMEVKTVPGEATEVESAGADGR